MNPLSWWGTFKALSWFSKGAAIPFISAIPGVGPILGFVFALVQLVWKVLMAAIKGLTSIFHTPKEVAALALVALFCVALGLHWGVKWNQHLVKQAKVEMNSLLSGLEDEDASDQALAEAAETARIHAEAIERDRIAHEEEIRAGVPPLTKMDPPPSVAVPEAPPVADAAVVAVPVASLRDLKPAKAGKRRKQDAGLFDGVLDSVGSAFDASKW